MDFSNIKPKKCLIVTASRRQARFIQKAYQEYQIEQGSHVWHSLNVLPWSAFIDKCWIYLQTKGVELPIRLGKEQSQYLWQQTVLKSKHTDLLLNSQQAVKLSYDAWRMLNQWQIQDYSFNHGDTDQEAFTEWYLEYKKQLSKYGWADSVQLANIVKEHLELVIQMLPQQMAFYGFQQTNPQQDLIIKAIKEKNEIIELSNKVYSQVSKALYNAESFEQELVAAVRWASEKVQENPEQSIGILVPGLEQQRALLERIVQSEIYPESLLSGEYENSWHDISVAESLDKKPMVEVTLLWLKLFDNSLSKEQLQTLLLTPYLYPNEEQAWLASRLELDIRKSNKEYYSLDSINELANKKDIELAWLTTINQSANQQSYSATSFKSFIKQVLKELEVLHWTGRQALTSGEFQLQQHLLEVIKAANKLGVVATKTLSWSQALNLLQIYIQEQSFHQETPNTPIKIMGMLEAVTLEFDSIWFVSATDKILPTKTSINPFLSKALQLKYNLPGSSHQRELEYAENILQSLYAKDELIFSYATHDGEQEQMLSPLLKETADRVGVKALELESALSKYLTDWPVAQLETYEDEQGLPIETDGYAAGGTGILKAQAASPFDAYLRYRLNLYPFETDDLGISFMDRGNLFHKIMQVLWQHLVTQQALINHTESELAKLVDRTITSILNIESKHLYLLNHQEFFQTEKERLRKLVLKSLEVDKGRVEFEVIATEARRKLEVGGLKINITIDRIDQLEDGSLIIIDYKTGVPRLIDLLNDPIGEPQLLLYAISEHTEKQPVAGILFYQAHLKASKYLGFTEASEMIDGVKALQDLANNPYANDFDNAIKEWRKMLNEIAESFKKGDASLTDYSGNYPDHYPISRWHERDYEWKETMQKLKPGAVNE